MLVECAQVVGAQGLDCDCGRREWPEAIPVLIGGGLAGLPLRFGQLEDISKIVTIRSPDDCANRP